MLATLKMTSRGDFAVNRGRFVSLQTGLEKGATVPQVSHAIRKYVRNVAQGDTYVARLLRANLVFHVTYGGKYYRLTWKQAAQRIVADEPFFLGR